MPTNNLFRGASNQVSQNQDFYVGNRGNTVNWANQNNYMMNREVRMSSLPGRVVFSPEQISPQEIPINGSPALFPLSDGSCIIVKALSQNGTFSEERYVLQQPLEEVPQNNEFDQVMNVLGDIRENLNKVLTDLYGKKTTTTRSKLDKEEVK